MSRPMVDTFMGITADEIAAYVQAKETIKGKIDTHTLVAFTKAYNKLRGSEGFLDQLKVWQKEADLSRARFGMVKAAENKRLADQKYKQALQLLSTLEAPADSV